MLISVCGTPCTGKTSSSSFLGDRGWYVVEERVLIKDLSLHDSVDETSGEMIVDPVKAKRGFADWSHELYTDTVLDGHMSYLAPWDICFILRVDPGVLRHRLEKRGYSPEKISDNVCSEVLGYVTSKCMLEYEDPGPEDQTEWNYGRRSCLERDVTDMSPYEISEWFLSVACSMRCKRLNPDPTYRPGNIDWLEAYSEWC